MIFGTYNFSTVNREPFSDPLGRWRVGGGIKIAPETSTSGCKAMEVKRALTLNRLICSVNHEQRK